MKKTLLMMTAAFAATLAAAAVEKTSVMDVWTAGPDFYADGTPVLAGETYLLVYVKAGAEFAGIYTDGSLVDPDNNQAVLKLPATSDSRCGYKQVQYHTSQFPANGSWELVLLDTRKNDGTVGGLIAAQGTSSAVAAPSAMTMNATLGGGAGLVAASDTVSPPAAPDSPLPPPTITGLSVDADSVTVSVDNVMDGSLYQIVSTDDLKTGGWQVVVERVQSDNLLADAVVPLNADKSKSGARFFKVMRKQ